LNLKVEELKNDQIENDFFIKKTYLACWLLLVTCSCKDYLQKQRGMREQAKKENPHNIEITNYKPCKTK
jgi:hypothetical protein